MARPRHLPPEDAQFPVITPLARGLQVLRTFQAGDPPLRNQEIARRTGIPPSTVSRLTGSLVALGYLSYDRKAQAYALTPAVIGLGYAFLGGISARYRLQPGMQALASMAGAAVALGTRDQIHMIYIECCKGNSTLPFRFDVGSSLPLARSAMGWAYLAGLDEPAFAQAMDTIRAADATGWRGTFRNIERARESVRTRGFCISMGAFEPGVHTVGAPVLTRPGEAFYALNCGAPAYQLKEEQLVEEIGPRLAWLARSVLQEAPPAG